MKIVIAPIRVRLFAHLLDASLCIALFWPISFLYSATLKPFISEQLALPAFASILDFLLVYGVIAAATIILWQRLGYTPGQNLQGLRVVDATSGQRLDWRRAALRLLFSVISGLSLVGLFWALIDKQKRTLHDLILNSTVTYVDELADTEQNLAEWLCSTK